MTPKLTLEHQGRETLEPWQGELILRLERGLVRRLNSADAECIAWNCVTGTMSVTARPLLDELRAHNLTSNVFRRALPGSGPRVPRPGRNER